MLTLTHHLSGRPWAIRAEAAEYLRGVLVKDGLAGLRDLAALRSALMVREDDEHPIAAAARSATSRNGATIAIIPIIGTVTQRGGLDMATCQGFRSTDAIAEEIRVAAAEPKIDAIVLEVDSPGGEVYGVPEAWQAISESTKAKPIIAAVNSVSASAAYYMSSAATEIWINPSGQVGSIGVYCLHVDFSKALSTVGEQWTFISAGKYKLEGNPIEPLNDEARYAIQAQVDSYYNDFVRDVARGRRVASSVVSNGFGQGRMVRAKDAVTERMADQIGTLDQAIARAAALGRKKRSGAGAARVSLHGTEPVLTREHFDTFTPRAGINEAPNLVEGTADRSCSTCEYFSKPAPAISSGACSLYDFTTQDMWVCDSWEALEAEPEPLPEPVPEPLPTVPVPVRVPEPGMTKEQRLALAALRTL
jgi:capsid assembly protease